MCLLFSGCWEEQLRSKTVSSQFQASVLKASLRSLQSAVCSLQVRESPQASGIVRSQSADTVQNLVCLLSATVVVQCLHNLHAPAGATECQMYLYLRGEKQWTQPVVWPPLAPALALDACLLDGRLLALSPKTSNSNSQVELRLSPTCLCCASLFRFITRFVLHSYLPSFIIPIYLTRSPFAVLISALYPVVHHLPSRPYSRCHTEQSNIPRVTVDSALPRLTLGSFVDGAFAGHSLER